MSKKPKHLKRCPGCGSRDFNQDLELEGDEVHEYASCDECGKSWTQIYEFADSEIDEA